VWAAFDYEGPIAAAIQALKYQGRDDLAVPLVRRWRLEWHVQVAPDRLVVPVPLHTRRLAKRGFDQAWLLAREVARAIGAEARPRALRRVRSTPPQVGLGRAERERNVRGAFAAALPLPGRDILLVDDVSTTGATLHACAEALLQAGARSVHGLVLARAQP
jgi:ComF family protein